MVATAVRVLEGFHEGVIREEEVYTLIANTIVGLLYGCYKGFRRDISGPRIVALL